MLEQKCLVRVLTMRRADADQLRWVAYGTWEWRDGVVIQHTQTGQKVLQPIGWYFYRPGDVVLIVKDDSTNLYRICVPLSHKQHIQEATPQIFIR